MINLGDIAKDTITGLTGAVVSRHEYLNGCVRVSLQPNEIKDGRPVEATTFDIEQIEVIQPAAHKMLARTGGPESAPSRPSTPSR